MTLLAGCGEHSGGANGFHHKQTKRQNSSPSANVNHITINLNDIQIDSDPEEASEQGAAGGGDRSEEHTSELQSPVPISYAVFCLKKKKKNKSKSNINNRD